MTGLPFPPSAMPLPTLPQASAPFVTFSALLRSNGFSVAPEQTTAFLAAIELLGPRRMRDIHHAAIATLALPIERRPAFDALFARHFLGEVQAADGTEGEAEDALHIQDDDGLAEGFDLAETVSESGEAATAAEALSARRLRPEGETAALRRLIREAPDRLPRRRGHRRQRAKHGDAPDRTRTLRQAVRNDGDVIRLFTSRRKPRQRRVLLLIDISGSMKAETDARLRFAHALGRAAERIEVFTIGTRLTRISRAIRLRNQAQALEAASTQVADWDGGTRLGDALQAFLAVPRYASFARGALVLVLSDGLERGDPSALIDAVARLRRRASRIGWLSPLAVDPAFVPETEALRAIQPLLDDLGDGSSTERLTRYVLDLDPGRAA